MKALLVPLVLLAGAAALWVARRTPAPTYAPPTEAAPAYTVIPEVLASPPGPGEVVHELEVEGMCCNGCPVKLHELLTQIDGVRIAAMSFDTSSAGVIASSDVSGDELVRALTFDKYRATLRAPTGAEQRP